MRVYKWVMYIATGLSLLLGMYGCALAAAPARPSPDGRQTLMHDGIA